MAKNILICDDAAFMRMMIKDILTKNGYNVAGEAENGLKAVEKFKEVNPDLVLMDITMPEMDGIQALKEIKKIVESIKAELTEKGIEYGEVEQGIMIETPAAVMISEELGKRVDFLSLGTNDLTQYTLAMDRQNLLLKDKYNDHHPALVKMIRMVTEAGHKSGCEVYICGELAADSNLTEAFIQMGVDGLSVVPACVLPVRKAIRSSYADDANRSEEAVKEK